MSTFTVRDLDRNPSAVLRACDTDGVAVIHSRSGRSYEIRPASSSGHRSGSSSFSEWLTRHRAWKKTTFPQKIPAAQVKAVDALLAGE